MQIFELYQYQFFEISIFRLINSLIKNCQIYPNIQSVIISSSYYNNLIISLFLNYKKTFFIYINNQNPIMSQDAIRVVCRLRTLNKIQMANNGQQCVQYDQKNIKINIGGDQNKYSFAFDKIFGPYAVQYQIYHEVATPVIKSVVSGYNGTIFAYGQTGAGKTWTMQGPNHYDQEFKGLIPRTVDGLFQQIRQSDENLEFVIKCSYVEIYNQKLFDLLDPSKSRLQIKQDKLKGVFIQNCTQISVGSSEQMLKVMNNGSQNRKVAFTGMNQRSSRSHSLFIIHISQKNTKKQSTKQSRLYFVDLAGSQKVGKTGVMGQQLQQAKSINKSLSALGNVINALTSQKKEHVPYRDSKLTRILQQSLGGNSKTTLIICCSMCTYNDKETLGTLRFGYRAKSIKNKAKMNEQKSAKQLLMLLQVANKTIYDLKMQLKTGIITELTAIQPLSSVNKQQQQQSPQSINPELLSQQIQHYKLQIQQLKRQILQHSVQDQQKQKSLKQYEFRMKSIILDLDRQKQQHQQHMKGCSVTYRKFKQFMSSINKYVNRAVLDIEYYVNSTMITSGTIDKGQHKHQNNANQKASQDLRNTLMNFMKQSQEYLQFYDERLKFIFQNVERQANCRDLENFQIKSDKGNCEQPVMRYEQDQQSFKSEGDNQKRRIRIALSQPQLFPQQFQPYGKQQLQMSYIYQRPQESMAITTSDKISQEQSFTQIQTLLQSLQTKESHKMILQELNSQLKMYKKDNQELGNRIQKLKQQNRTIQKQLQAKYQQAMVDLQERAQQYKNIIGKKDQQIQEYLKKYDNMKRQIAEEKVVSQRFKKIIQSNSSMKQYYQMEQRVRTLASQRQKLFNQMFKLREQLDESDVTIKQKQQHIQSLKEVMKQLSQNMSTHNWYKKQENHNHVESSSPRQIQKRYNAKVYGTQAPNVIQPIRGGDSGKKKSSLRRKIPIEIKKQQKNQKGGIGAYFKGFFG